MPAARSNPQTRPGVTGKWRPEHEQLFHGVGCAPRDVRFSFRTGTWTDVGSWFGKRPVHLAVTGTRLLVWAMGPRPYCQAVRFSQVAGSFYNPMTGQLILAPVEDLKLNALTMSHDRAVQVIKYIQERI